MQFIKGLIQILPKLVEIFTLTSGSFVSGVYCFLDKTVLLQYLKSHR